MTDDKGAAQPPGPPPDEDDEFADDEDEQEEGLEPGRVQKVLAPFYLFMALVFLVVAAIPFLIIYTVLRIVWAASGG